MRRICFFSIVCLCSLFVCAQTCEGLTAEFEFLEAKYKKLEKTSEKKKCIENLELVISRAEEANCELSRKWYKEVNQWKQALYPSTVFTRGSYTFPASYDVIQIGVKQKKSLKVVREALPNWLELRESENPQCFEFAIKENVLPYARTGIVEVVDSKKRHQCRVVQAAAPLRAKVTERIGFGQDGGASFIFVETNDTAWTVTSDDRWLTTELTEYGAKVICTPNPSKQKRSSSVHVRLAHGDEREVVISQTIGKTTLSVPQKSFTFSNYGETNNNVTIECNYDQWSATPDVNWVKVQKKYGGISIECLPNRVASVRKANVKIETNDAEHLVEYIRITQEEAQAYLSTEQSSYRSDGYDRTVNIKVKTNIPNWSYSVEKGANWTSASKSGNNLQVHLRRNDWNSSRTSEVRLYGKNQSYTISLTQPNRGYAGRYNDYFDALDGTWRIMWFSIDFHGLTTVGDNISIFNARWKPVEISLINFNLDYIQEGFSASWEPIIRGYLPVGRDGFWAPYIGMGGHVCMTGGTSHFLFEMGAELNWNCLMSSRVFFKYNGGCSLGMSFDLGTWL